MAKHYLMLSKVLQKLLYNKRMNASELAREVNLPVPTVHRLVTGKSTRPYPSSLKPIADFFSIEVAQLLGEKPLTLEKENIPKESHLTTIPLIPMDQLDSPNNKQNNPQIPFVGSISEAGFASIMPDSSMEPFVQRNSIIIFDPNIKPTDRSCILVKLYETNGYVLRQLLIDADHQYLKPLNPDLSAFKMRLLHKNDQIIACLVEIRFNIQTANDPKNSTGVKA